ncbi:MAG TPA: chromosomal replication initiator protein DnaA [Solirubrobacteraceae bacterium]|nr:chromosomal replication initiator protein DnaA [Solirubrobacteraceae bacterium]
MDLPANVEPNAAWHDICAEVRRVLGDSAYELWIAPLQVRELDQHHLLIAAPPATQSWVANRFGRVLESCAQTVLGAAVRVVVEGSTSPRPRAAPLPTAGDHLSTLNPRYSFNQFVIGDGNRLAHGACLVAAELPGQAFNPLFLHAPPGLGKTHLLHAIGNYVTLFSGGATVRYATAETFTNHFLGALGSRSLDQFKHAYRNVDVLLVDDVQFLASKARTEEEFFHTFNALYETGRQLVLTCDRLPQELLGLEERLRERFEAGLVADISPPDLHTRMAILRKRALLDRLPVDNQAVLELIAERITDNVRALEGALIRVIAYHSLTHRPIDVELTRRVLDTMYPQKGGRTKPSHAEIQATVASFYNLSKTELVSPSRQSRIAWPRQVAIYLIRELTGESLQAIGEAFGGRNHATVLHACKRVSERIVVDNQAKSDLQELRQRVVAGEADRAC